jgi:hypothetical protein
LSRLSAIIQTPSPGSASRPTRDLLGRGETIVANPLFAYGAIIALQLRVIWNVWRYKDLTAGDTASYFLDAAGWAHGLHDDIVWSPLYSDFWGTILAAVHNVYAAAMVHRVAIILAAAILVLALMRRLMHPAVALLIAAWWAILPVNYNVLYEVHLFGVLPILVAALIVARSPGRVSIGIALAILASSALLLRNELVIATIIVAAAIVVYETRERRKQSTPVSKYLRAYGIPLAIVCLLTAGVYWRSHVQGDAVIPVFESKQDVNMCQVYAFNFQQRHPSRFTGNPFSECASLMKQTFGYPMPSLVRATIANPQAIAGFMKWNLELWPSGLQVSLFNATSTGDQPDYPPVETHRAYALILSILVIVLVIAGLLAVRRDSKFWLRDWLPSRIWAVIVLGAAAITTFYVVLTQRPRPEYTYSLTVGLMALVGVCGWALLRRLGWTRYVSLCASGLVLVLVLALPSYYHPEPRPMHDAIQRLAVIRGRLQQRRSVLVVSQLNPDVCAYLAATDARYCTLVEWPALQAQLARGVPIRTVLNQVNATVIYAEAVLLANPSIAKLVAAPPAMGWRQIAGGSGSTGPWRILIRES